MKYTRITLRIPEPLHERLSEEAEASSKSMNAEIIGRLQQTFDSADSGVRVVSGLGAGDRDYEKMLVEMAEKVDAIMNAIEQKEE